MPWMVAMWSGMMALTEAADEVSWRHSTSTASLKSCHLRTLVLLSVQALPPSLVPWAPGPSLALWALELPLALWALVLLPELALAVSLALWALAVSLVLRVLALSPVLWALELSLSPCVRAPWAPWALLQVLALAL